MRVNQCSVGTVAAPGRARRRSAGSAATMSLHVQDWGAAVQSAPASTITNNDNSPTFAPADQVLSVLGRFRSSDLEDDGDYVHLKGKLLLTRSSTSTNLGENSLSTQLRFGLFNGPDVAVAGSQTNTGLFVTYANNGAQTANRRIRQVTTGTNPFAGMNDVSDPSTADVDNDSLRGLNIGPVDFELKITRNSNALDLYAVISGTDSVTGRPYFTEYTKNGFVPGAVGFTFDRAGFFFGNNVDGTSATLERVRVITNVPEPAAMLLAVSTVIGGAFMTRRRQRAA